jgi:hypothetical protein
VLLVESSSTFATEYWAGEPFTIFESVRLGQRDDKACHAYIHDLRFILSSICYWSLVAKSARVLVGESRRRPSVLSFASVCRLWLVLPALALILSKILRERERNLFRPALNTLELTGYLHHKSSHASRSADPKAHCLSTLGIIPWCLSPSYSDMGMQARVLRHRVAAILTRLTFGATGEQITEFEVIDRCPPRVVFSSVSSRVAAKIGQLRTRRLPCSLEKKKLAHCTAASLSQDGTQYDQAKYIPMLSVIMHHGTTI